MSASTVYTDHYESGVDVAQDASATAAARSFGAANADRQVVVAVALRYTGSSGTLPDLTIGGVTATAIASRQNGQSWAILYGAALASGTSGDIVITARGSSLLRWGCAVYAARGVGLTGTSAGVAAGSGTNSANVTLNPTSAGALFAVGFTGRTTAGGNRISAASSIVAAGSLTVTSAFDSSSGLTTWSGGSLTKDLDAQLESVAAAAQAVVAAVLYEADTSGGALSGGAALTLDALVTSSAATLLVKGAVAATLGQVLASGAAGVAIAGTATTTLAPVAASAAGSLPLVGQATLGIGAITVASGGSLALAGTATATLGPVISASAAHLDILGTAACTLGAVGVAASGSLAVEGSGQATITLGAIGLTSVAALRVAGAGATTLGAITATGVSGVSILSSASLQLGTITAAAAGRLTTTAQVGVALAAVSASAEAKLEVSAATLVMLGDVALVAVGMFEGGLIDPGNVPGFYANPRSGFVAAFRQGFTATTARGGFRR